MRHRNLHGFACAFDNGIRMGGFILAWSWRFLCKSILLGMGLAMDAFSVSLANGLSEAKMNRLKMCVIAGVFAVFQFAMPMIGWICVHTILQYFTILEAFIPWIAFLLLAVIGANMVREGIKNQSDQETTPHLTVSVLMLQGIATSIDALSVGFTIAEYGWLTALISSLIIGIVTFIICMIGLLIGKTFGTKFANQAQIFGGLLLIAIGAEIFITNLL